MSQFAMTQQPATCQAIHLIGPFEAIQPSAAQGSCGDFKWELPHEVYSF